MRLIDADSLLANMDKGIQGTAREYLKFYQMAVNDEPTAYDVDKVVEQLEKDTEFAYNIYMDCSPNAPQSVHVRYYTQYQERKRCLDIVKSSVTE